MDFSFENMKGKIQFISDYSESLYRDARAQRDLNTKQSIVFEPLPAQNPIANPGRARRKLNFFFDVMLAVLYCTVL